MGLLARSVSEEMAISVEN